jgi:hypothetical protein
MASWILGAIAAVSVLALCAAAGMYAVAAQQNAELRRALRVRRR